MVSNAFVGGPIIGEDGLGIRCGVFTNEAVKRLAVGPWDDLEHYLPFSLASTDETS